MESEPYLGSPLQSCGNNCWSFDLTHGTSSSARRSLANCYWTLFNSSLSSTFQTPSGFYCCKPGGSSPGNTYVFFGFLLLLRDRIMCHHLWHIWSTIHWWMKNEPYGFRLEALRQKQTLQVTPQIWNCIKQPPESILDFYRANRKDWKVFSFQYLGNLMKVYLLFCNYHINFNFN